jgi:hypothetical protein
MGLEGAVWADTDGLVVTGNQEGAKIPATAIAIRPRRLFPQRQTGEIIDKKTETDDTFDTFKRGIIAGQKFSKNKKLHHR